MGRPKIQLSGVIPYRRRNGTLEVLLVTSKRRGRWIIPKGRLEPDLSRRQSAKKEAYEEAGVKGKVRREPLGWYYHSAASGLLATEVFAMRVETEFDAWPEQDERRRRWMPFKKARRQIDEPGLRLLFDTLAEQIS